MWKTIDGRGIAFCKSVPLLPHNFGHSTSLPVTNYLTGRGRLERAQRIACVDARRVYKRQRCDCWAVSFNLRYAVVSTRPTHPRTVCILCFRWYYSLPSGHSEPPEPMMKLCLINISFFPMFSALKTSLAGDVGMLMMAQLLSLLWSSQSAIHWGFLFSGTYAL